LKVKEFALSAPDKPYSHAFAQANALALESKDSLLE